ncbi:hypothetical protein Tsubulata_032448 [Turnera subulata]|uniref:Uncharacterized protein n=1 Tax=Turnera subulata TaxID=218843 RepID=A0A9Q0F9Z8_9ROSI|nr:hypothetical protein Tsubulata_032448 [Turnera subulata]
MSNCPGLYSDIGKKARDLLRGDYAHQPRTHFGYGCFKWNFDLSCETAEILPGLTTLFRFKIPDSSKVELRFLQDYIGITSGVGVKALQQGTFNGNGYNPVVNFSGVIGSTFFSLGTDIAFNVSGKTFDEVSVGLSFNSDFLVTSLTLDDKCETLRASCYHELNPLSRTAVAAELKHRFSNGATTVTVGGQHSLFPYTLMKARINSKGRVGGLIQLEFLEKLFIGITGETDMWADNNISKFGLSMAFKA